MGFNSGFKGLIRQNVDCVWNVMAHAQKPDFVFRRNGRVHLNRSWGRQFSRLLAAEVCASAVVMLDKPCSEVVWRVLATHSIRQFLLHFPSLASPCAITFQLDFAKLTEICANRIFVEYKKADVSQICCRSLSGRLIGIKRTANLIPSTGHCT